MTSNRIVSITPHFQDFPDPRREHPSKLHKLIDIIVIALCGLLAKCETWDDIADHAEERADFFKTLLELPNGIPSHDTITRTFSILDPELWQDYFGTWMKAQTAVSAEKIRHLQIDGKVLRGSKTTGNGKQSKQKREAVEIVSAWSSEQQLVIAQVTVQPGSNEIKAVPALLEQLDLAGTVVSLDAMGAQQDTTAAIIQGGGDYLVALKGNQGRLHQAAQDLFEDVQRDQGRTREVPSQAQSFDVAHGREETRYCFVLRDLEQLQVADCGVENWGGLRSLIVVKSTRKTQGKTSVETRFFLCSALWDATTALARVRGHWSIENQQHYVLDVVFAEDANRTRRGFAAQNLAVLRRMALNLLNLETVFSTSKRRQRLKALMSNDYLRLLLGVTA